MPPPPPPPARRRRFFHFDAEAADYFDVTRHFAPDYAH
jgi:hypothetical protein